MPHLPMSEQAAILAARDPSDVGSILLLEVLAPAALLAEDKDLVNRAGFRPRLLTSRSWM